MAHIYQERLKQLFKELFHKQPQILIKAPGRINLLGEHTDYNGGLVLPAAIHKALYFAVSKRDDGQCRLYSESYLESHTFLLDSLHREGPSWTFYIKGVLAEFDKLGIEVGGFDMVFGGDIPLGAGLSSSAALECGVAYAINELYALGLDKIQLVRIAQAAENNFVEVNCGIMDQFASMMGKRDQVIQLDCRSLKYSYFPLHMEDHMIILCDTGVKHNLGDSEYNKRRQQCEEGVAIISKHIEGVLCLRDLSVEVLAAYKSELTPIVYNRCKYVVEEIARVEEACLLLEQGHMKAFGQKMYDTHMGLRDLYEVSCPELDFLVDFTLSSDDVLGARMMGGGFGGCTINIVSKDYSTTFTTDISEAYKRQFHRSLKTYQTQICNGTGIVDEDLT